MADPFLQQMIDAGMVDDRVRLLMQSMQRGQALRATPSAQGMNVGQTYRASSPLEHLATAMSRVKGEKMIGEAEGQMGGLLDQKRAGRMAFAENPQPLAGALSGDPAIGAAGGVLLGQQAAERAAAERAKADAIAAAEREAQATHRGRVQTETERHNRAMEGRPPSFPVLVGEGGAQYRIDPRNPTAPAVPVVDDAGKPILKPQGGGHGGMAEVAERKRVMLSDGQVKTVAEYDRFLDALADIQARKAQVDTGPVAARRNALAASVGLNDPEVSSFRAMVGDSLATYIRNLSGAAVSDKERAFLIQNVPKIEDNDQVFAAKLQAVTERLQRLRAMELSLFGQQGKDVSGFTGGAAPAASHGGHASEAPRRRRFNPATGALE